MSERSFEVRGREVLKGKRSATMNSSEQFDRGFDGSIFRIGKLSPPFFVPDHHRSFLLRHGEFEANIKIQRMVLAPEKNPDLEILKIVSWNDGRMETRGRDVNPTSCLR